MRWFSLPLLAIVAAGMVSAPAGAAEPKIRVLLTYGGHPFEEKPFFAMFDAMPGIQYTKAPLPKSYEMLKPGLEKECDVIVMYDMAGKSSPEAEKAFVALVNQGIGLVSLHHNIAAHADWLEFTKIRGGRYFLKPEEWAGKQYGRSRWKEGEQIHVTVADKEHPITRGLSDFTIHDETYDGYYVEPAARVLLTTDHAKNERTIAWVNTYGKSRLFYLQLGHDSKAWTNPAYAEILSRGIRWAAGR